MVFNSTSTTEIAYAKKKAVLLLILFKTTIVMNVPKRLITIIICPNVIKFQSVLMINISIQMHQFVSLTSKSVRMTKSSTVS